MSRGTTTRARLARLAWSLLSEEPERIDDMEREECLNLLQWNDPNGCYTDADSIAEGLPCLSTEEARERLRGEVLAGGRD